MYGNKVRTAHDGPEAVAEVKHFLPDLVLLELGMPGLEGYAACNRLRSQPWGNSLTIVALTGWGEDADRVKTKEAGFDNHLIKPVGPSEVHRILVEIESKKT